MKNLEEDFPRLHESAVAKAAKINKARTGVGCDGFHPKVPSDLTKETREEVVEFLEKVEQSGKWPQQSCTAMFFLIPKNVTSERPIALMLMIRWWEALRTTDGRNSLGKCVGDGGKRSGSFSFGLGERVGDARQFSQGRSCGCCAGISSIQRRVQFEGCAAEPPPDYHGHPARVKVELLTFTYCVCRMH